jgi:hypothetical protein
MSEKPPKWKIIVNDVMFFSGGMMIIGRLILDWAMEELETPV